MKKKTILTQKEQHCKIISLNIISNSNENLKNYDNINAHSIRVELPLSQFEKNKNIANNSNYTKNMSQIEKNLVEKNGMDNDRTGNKKPKDYKGIHSKELMNKWKLKTTENDGKKKSGGK